MIEKSEAEKGVEKKNLEDQLLRSQVEQGKFNGLLVLTALILALGSILEYFDFKYHWDKSPEFISSFLEGVLFVVFIILVGCIIKLIFKVLLTKSSKK